jgi:hypothetical protein
MDTISFEELRQQKIDAAQARALAFLRGIGIVWIPAVPRIERIHQTVYAAALRGTLDMKHWHGPSARFCGTVHCRAGWVVHLTGEWGREAEASYFKPSVLAEAVYLASGYDGPLDFNPYGLHGESPDKWNATVLDDMRRLAEAEARGEPVSL